MWDVASIAASSMYDDDGCASRVPAVAAETTWTEEAVSPATSAYSMDCDPNVSARTDAWVRLAEEAMAAMATTAACTAYLLETRYSIRCFAGAISLETWRCA
jgi:hypothetical protein